MPALFSLRLFLTLEVDSPLKYCFYVCWVEFIIFFSVYSPQKIYSQLRFGDTTTTYYLSLMCSPDSQFIIIFGIHVVSHPFAKEVYALANYSNLFAAITLGYILHGMCNFLSCKYSAVSSVGMLLSLLLPVSKPQ